MGSAHEATLDVAGMTCASCVRRVERALGRVPGVEDVRVNLATERATVRFDPDVTAPDAMRRAVADAGYVIRATPPVRDDSAARNARDRALACVAIGAVMMLAMALPDVPGERWAMLLAASWVQFVAARGIVRAAWKAARHGVADMDTLVTLGSGVAYGYSAFVTLAPRTAAHIGLPPHAYFESGVLIVGLVLLGRWLEARARWQTGAAVRALSARRARTARRVDDDGVERDVPVDSVRVGDRVRVRPGETVAVDGVVLDGRGALDESMLTGESRAVDKSPGDAVLGATLNLRGAFVLRATQVGDATTLAQIVRLVGSAQSSKPPIQRTVDRITQGFVPAVLLLSGATFTGWMLTHGGFAHALFAAVAVLLVACPCALGLATPTALVVGTGRAAERGILVRDGEALERATRIDTVVLDKTGTLTRARPDVVTTLVCDGWDETALLRVAAAVESGSEHPLASAILARARAIGVEISSANDFAVIEGQGVTAQLEGRAVAVGSHALVPHGQHDAQQALAAQLPPEATRVYVLVDQRLAGAFALRDTVRPEARDAVDALHAMGLQVWMLTGDRAEAAAPIATAVGIDRVLADVDPAGKVARIAALQGEGRVVAMVGDGLNDAAALARADLGIAIGTGTDVALAAADVTLVGADLRGIAASLRIARATVRTIRQSLGWAFGYNVVLIPVAMGLTGRMLHPSLAAAAMALSSVSVVGNALRLRRLA